MNTGPAREAVSEAMIEAGRQDAPGVGGLIRKGYGLYHGWYFNAKPNMMGNNGLKYLRIVPALRERQRAAWNKPLLWPLFALGALLLLALVPAVLVWRRKLHAPARGEGTPK